ncbi:MAG TPA: ABC transporter substrate-binding protein [Solirubrobacter sp.]|nr:ABC transporter substrate-binding protein [Solirubrobacter sp.]
MLHRINAFRLRAPLVLSLSAVLAAGVIAAGCGSDDDEPASGSSATGNQSAEMQDVNLVLPAPLGIYFPSVVVAQKKFWPEAGLNVKLLPTDGSPVVAQQLVSGQQDYGMLTADTLYLSNVEGSDLRGVSLMTHDDAALLSVPEDSPIRSVSELRGKSIGVTSAGDGAIPLTKVVLADAGIEEGDYKLPVIGPGGPAAAQALKNGRVAAYAHGISDVGGMESVAKVKLRSIMPEKFVGLPGNVLGVSQKVLDDPAKKEIVKKLAEGRIAAAEYLKTNPEESYKILCDELPEQCQDEGTAKAIIARATISNGPAGSDPPGVINLEKAQTLVDAFVKDTSIDVATVFPQDVFAGS